MDGEVAEDKALDVSFDVLSISLSAVNGKFAEDSALHARCI